MKKSYEGPAQGNPFNELIDRSIEVSKQLAFEIVRMSIKAADRAECIRQKVDSYRRVIGMICSENVLAAGLIAARINCKRERAEKHPRKATSIL